MLGVSNAKDSFKVERFQILFAQPELSELETFDLPQFIIFMLQLHPLLLLKTLPSLD